MKRADFLASFPAHVAAAIQKHKLPTHHYSGARYERVGDAVWLDYARVLVLRVDPPADWIGDPGTFLRSILQLPGAEETGLLSPLFRAVEEDHYEPAAPAWEHEREHVVSERRVSGGARTRTGIKGARTRTVEVRTRVIPVGCALVNADMLRAVEQLFPGCEWSAAGELDPVVASLCGRRVAYVMPYRQ